MDHPYPTISAAAARALMLVAQGLEPRQRKPATKKDVLQAIRRMSALQIDSISVVARSPYLVLWSRLGVYQPRWLDELLAEGKLFEYWAHAACFLPIEDYALYRSRMEERDGATAWLEANPDLAARVLDHVRREGEVRSSTWEREDGKAGGWWSWKPEKTALECLFSTGRLMIVRRDNFQRVYDLRERVLPGWDDAGALSPDEAQRALAVNAVRALGVVKARWVPDYFKQRKTGIARVLDEAVDDGVLLRVGVEGWDGPGYVHAENATLLKTAERLSPVRTTLLSPFDPLVWDRARAQELFGFSYRIEVYTPAAKRRYGYYTLPILHRGALVGRLDPKVYRKESRFVVQALHLEPDVTRTEDLARDLAAALVDCAGWHGATQVEVLQSDPPIFADAVRQHLPH